MSYFKNFPLLNYKFQLDQKNSKAARNILIGAKIIEAFDSDKTKNIFVDYLIRDGERPEHIAERVYGRPDLHWILLMSNGIVNPYFDWPLSQNELQAYLAETYPGIALFFDCTQGNTGFYIKNSNTQLSISNSNFVVGETVTQGTVTGTVHRWDSTLRKLELKNLSFSDPNYSFKTTSPVISINNQGQDIQATAKRIVYINADSVKHFIDDFGNFLDPYGKIDFAKYPDGKVYSSENIVQQGNTQISSSNNFVLNLYTNENRNENVVSCRQYESFKNDSKRKIRVLKSEYAEAILQELPKILQPD